MLDVISWVNLIKESIKRKNFNPWDIDLIKIADAYLETIKVYKKFDIKLSADVILVGGILLKLKSQSLYLNSLPKNQETDSQNFSTIQKDPNKKIKRKESTPKRKTTLNDLIKLIKKELSKKNKNSHLRTNRIKKSHIANEDNLTEILNELLEDDKDIEKKLIFIYNLLLEKSYFEIKKEFKDKIKTYFLPLIIAANEGKCEIIQKRYFEDLYVKSKVGGFVNE